MEKIDLHGLKHDEIKNILIRKIEDLWETDTELEIITGYSEKMKSIVIEVLEEYGLVYRIGDYFGFNELPRH